MIIIDRRWEVAEKAGTLLWGGWSFEGIIYGLIGITEQDIVLWVIRAEWGQRGELILVSGKFRIALRIELHSEHFLVLVAFEIFFDCCDTFYVFDAILFIGMQLASMV